MRQPGYHAALAWLSALLVVLLAALASLPLAAQQNGGISLDVKKADVQDVIRILTRESGAKFGFDPNEIKGEITMKVADYSLEQLLDLLCTTHGWHWWKQADAYVISSRPQPGTEPPAELKVEEPKKRTKYVEFQLQHVDVYDIMSLFWPNQQPRSASFQAMVAASGFGSIVPSMPAEPHKLASSDNGGGNPAGAGAGSAPTGPPQVIPVSPNRNNGSLGTSEQPTQYYPGVGGYTGGAGFGGVTGTVPGVGLGGGGYGYGGGYGGGYGTGAGTYGGGPGGYPYGGYPPGQPLPSRVRGAGGPLGWLLPDGLTGPPVAYDPRNVVIVEGTEDAIEQFRSLIAMLDVKVPQVLIQAQFVTVTRDETNQYGIDWTFAGKGFNISAANLNPGGDIAVAVQRGVSFAATLQALLRTNRGRVVSAPRVTTFNNTPVAIQFVEQTPYFTTTVVQGVVGQQAQATQVNFVSTGVQLQVLPRVNGDGSITAYVTPTTSEVTRFVSGPAGTQIPVTSTRTMTVPIRVNDGDTIVMGGLTSRTESRNETKVPLLSDIPIIGKLFKGVRIIYTDSELLVFLTASVIREEESGTVSPGIITPGGGGVIGPGQ